LPEHPLRRISYTIGIFQFLTGPAYFRTVIQGGPRYDLEGNPRGEVTPQEQDQARRDLHAFYEQRKKSRAASPPTPREASSAEGLVGAEQGD
jgi:ProP effector